MSAGALAHDLSTAQPLSTIVTSRAGSLAQAESSTVPGSVNGGPGTTEHSFPRRDAPSVVVDNRASTFTATIELKSSSPQNTASLAKPARSLEAIYAESCGDPTMQEADHLKTHAAPAFAQDANSSIATAVDSNSPSSQAAPANEKAVPPEKQRVTIWNRLQGRKIAGNAAPLPRNLEKYLREHPHCERYTDQDKAPRINVNRPILPTNAAPPIQAHPASVASIAHYPTTLPLHSGHSVAPTGVMTGNPVAMAAAAAAASAVFTSSANPNDYAALAAAIAQQNQRAAQYMMHHQHQPQHPQHYPLHSQQFQQQQLLHQHQLQQNQNCLQQHEQKLPQIHEQQLQQQQMEQQQVHRQEQQRLEEVRHQQLQLQQQQSQPQLRYPPENHGAVSLKQQDLTSGSNVPQSDPLQTSAMGHQFTQHFISDEHRQSVLEAMSRQSSAQVQTQTALVGGLQPSPNLQQSLNPQISQLQQITSALSGIGNALQASQSETAPLLGNGNGSAQLVNGGMSEPHLMDFSRNSSSVEASDLLINPSQTRLCSSFPEVQSLPHGQAGSTTFSMASKVDVSGELCAVTRSDAHGRPVSSQSQAPEEPLNILRQLADSEEQMTAVLQAEGSGLPVQYAENYNSSHQQVHCNTAMFPGSVLSTNNLASIPLSTRHDVIHHSQNHSFTQDGTSSADLGNSVHPSAVVTPGKTFETSPRNYDLSLNEQVISSNLAQKVSPPQREVVQLQRGVHHPLVQQKRLPDASSDSLAAHQLRFLSLRDDQENAEAIDSMQDCAQGTQSSSGVSGHVDSDAVQQSIADKIIEPPIKTEGLEHGTFASNVADDKRSSLLSVSGRSVDELPGRIENVTCDATSDIQNPTQSNPESTALGSRVSSSSVVCPLVDLGSVPGASLSQDVCVDPPGSSSQQNQTQAHPTELVDLVDKDVSTADRLDHEFFGDSTRMSGIHVNSQGGFLVSDPKVAGAKRVRGSAGALCGVPPSKPSTDALSRNLQRDVSIEGLRFFREPSADWLSRRLSSREPSFENPLLSHHHRDMSISSEFGRPLRSHPSMEMQISTPKGLSFLHHGSIGEEMSASTGGFAVSSIFPSFDANLTAEFAEGAVNGDGLGSCAQDSQTNAVLMNSLPAAPSLSNHISRSRHILSRDDLMLDFAPHQTDKSLPGSLYKYASGGSIEDFRDVKMPYI